MTLPPPCTIVIPARNATPWLQRSLGSIMASLPFGWEVILVNDASTDHTADLAQTLGATVISHTHSTGPAQARNTGVSHSRGDIIIFLDADVEATASTLTGLRDALVKNSQLHAVFGSYDSRPAVQTTVSLFRNLLHHYIHKKHQGPVPTFWSGCGAIRRTVFEEIGGFYPQSIACMEDIDLGYRLTDAGFHIELHPHIQCKHLKRWTLLNTLKTDIFKRATPWTIMLLQRRRAETSLNLQKTETLSALYVALFLGCAAAGLALPGLLPSIIFLTLSATFLSIFLYIQFDFYQFLAQRRGLSFSMAAFPLHLTYYASAITGAILGFFLWITGIAELISRRNRTRQQGSS